MTRRERMERKLKRREKWAGKADDRATQRLGAASEIQDQIPLGQPILVDHYSARRMRSAQKRIRKNTDKGIEEIAKAKRHRSKARGIADQLDRSIYSDDHGAAEKLRERIAKREIEAKQNAAINRAWRKTSGSIEERTAQLVEREICGEKLAATIARTMELCPWVNQPLDTTNLRASIRRDKKRLATLIEV